MKKIIFAVTTDLNYDQRMQRICTTLQREGFAVTLVGRKWPTSQPLAPAPYQQYRLSCFFSSGKLFYAEYSLRLALYLLIRKYDVYCAVDLDTALPMVAKARMAGAVFGYDAHEYFPEVVEVTDRPVIKKVWETVEQVVVPRTDFAYTVTSSLAYLFEKKYGRKFQVVRNIPPLEGFAPRPKPEKYILYRGALNAGRGLEVLLQAMQQVEGRLVLCGEGDLSAELRRLAGELGVGEKVEFRGYLLPGHLLEVTRQAYVGVMLLENRGQSYYYSLSNKFFDYLHAGIPQISVDFPEYRLLNDRYRVADLVSLNPSDISRSLNRLLHDHHHYRTLASNCERARQELNWQQEEQHLISLYKQLWKGRAPKAKSTLS